jgi:hypothetical protein
MQKKIITVEDPVEYTIDGVVQGQIDRGLNLSYVDFLKSMMRQDPDILMVGEIREVTAAEAVIQAALTGHKVLSTFHTDDSTGALLRLMDMGIDTFLISSTVVSVVAQRLVRILCPHCREPHDPDPSLLAPFNISSINLARYTFYKPMGCLHCGGTGFKGRTAIHEILVVNDAIRNAILARQTSSQIRLIAREKADLITMHDDSFYKAAQGITSLEEILRVIFYNEADEKYIRPADDIMARCMENGAFIKSPLRAFPRATLRLPEVNPVKTPAIDDLSGEVFYRARFEPATIAGANGSLAKLFREYQKLAARTGRTVDANLLTKFVELIVSKVKDLEARSEAAYVDFHLKVIGGKVKIHYMASNPQKPSSSTGPKRNRNEQKVIDLSSFSSESGRVGSK